MQDTALEEHGPAPTAQCLAGQFLGCLSRDLIPAGAGAQPPPELVQPAWCWGLWGLSHRTESSSGGTFPSEPVLSLLPPSLHPAIPSCRGVLSLNGEKAARGRRAGPGPAAASGNISHTAAFLSLQSHQGCWHCREERGPSFAGAAQNTPLPSCSPGWEPFLLSGCISAAATQCSWRAPDSARLGTPSKGEARAAQEMRRTTISSICWSPLLQRALWSPPSPARANSREFILSAVVVMGSQIPQDSLESEKGEARAQHAHQPGQIFASHSHSGSLLCIADSICPPQGSTDPSCSYPGTCSLEMGRLCFVQSPWQGEGTVWIQLPVPPAMTGVSGSVCRSHSRGCQDLQGQSLQQGVRHVPWQSQPVLPLHIPTWPSLLFSEKNFPP